MRQLTHSCGTDAVRLAAAHPLEERFSVLLGKDGRISVRAQRRSQSRQGVPHSHQQVLVWVLLYSGKIRPE